MFVIDANIIIAALLKDSKTREIVVSGKFTLVSPDYLLEELDKHEDYVIRKIGISKAELKVLSSLLLKRVRIVPHEEYSNKIAEAKKMMVNDVKDIPYVACYLSLKCDGIWTNDSDFKGKRQIRAFGTDYLLKLM